MIIQYTQEAYMSGTVSESINQISLRISLTHIIFHLNLISGIFKGINLWVLRGYSDVHLATYSVVLLHPETGFHYLTWLIKIRHILISDLYAITHFHRRYSPNQIFFYWIQWNTSIITAQWWFFQNSSFLVLLLTDENRQTSDPDIFWYLIF